MLNPPEKKTAFVSIFAIFFSAIVISILTAIYILLVKQIQTMNIDAQSFQALYTADSAFECLIYKEQNATGTASIFLTANSGSLGNCGTTVNGVADLSWKTSPANQPQVGKSVRAKSTANFSLISQDVDFCAVIDIDVETKDSSLWTTPPLPNFMTIAGHNKACGTASEKVVERVIDFYF